MYDCLTKEFPHSGSDSTVSVLHQPLSVEFSLSFESHPSKPNSGAKVTMRSIFDPSGSVTGNVFRKTPGGATTRNSYVFTEVLEIPYYPSVCTFVQ